MILMPCCKLSEFLCQFLHCLAEKPSESNTNEIDSKWTGE